MKYVLIILFGGFFYTGYAQTFITDGYTDKLSYRSGPGEDPVTFYINANGNYTNVDLELYTVDHQPTGYKISGFNLSPQTPAANSWVNGYGYSPANVTWDVPSDFPSGIYFLDNKISFIVKGDKNAHVVIVYPTNTNQAYNFTPGPDPGGMSFYTPYGVNYPPVLSFHRPYIPDPNPVPNAKFGDGFMKWDYYHRNYDVNIISDVDMDADYSEIENAKLLIIPGHSEYWTKNARLNFDRFVNEGKDALVLSGNTMYWQVRYQKDPNNPSNPQIVCYKSDDSGLTDPGPAEFETKKWANTDYSNSVSIGVTYKDHGDDYGTCSNYGGWNGYKVLLPNSPLLQGLSLNKYDKIPFITDEYDGPVISNLPFVLAHQQDPIWNESSLYRKEIVGYDLSSSNCDTPYAVAGLLVFQKTCSSGRIINASTTDWCTNLTWDGNPSGEMVKKITQNAINLCLSGSELFASPPCGNVLDLCAISFSDFPFYYNYPPPTCNIKSSTAACNNGLGLITSGSSVNYQAYSSISLVPGFSVQQGANFQASILPCALGVPRKAQPKESYNSPITIKAKEIKNKKVFMTIIPNPSKGSFKVVFTSPNNGEIQISNCLGQIVKRINTNNAKEIFLNLPDLKEGLYNITFIGDNVLYQERCLIQR